MFFLWYRPAERQAEPSRKGAPAIMLDGLRELTKFFESRGRRILMEWVTWLFGARQRPLELGPQPKVLVVRLDDRVGNLVLLTPLIATLRARLPNAQIDLVASPRGLLLLEGHPTLQRIIPFIKKSLLGPMGPLRSVLTVRRERYDLAIDAGNPTQHSTLHGLLVRLSGARHTIGVSRPSRAQLVSSPVTIPAELEHEIDLRLALLSPIAGEALARSVSIRPLPDAPRIRQFCEAHPGPRALINIGARLPEKQLGLDAYQQIVEQVQQAGFTPILSFGPTEEDMARAIETSSSGILAPPTALLELASLMAASELVVTCDTGPMHIAVAVGTPTCGIFVTTPPERFGYATEPHICLDARNGFTPTQREYLGSWLARQGVTSSAQL